MKKRVSKQHTIEMVFPLIFILIFCFCAIMLILGGTKIYQKTVSGLYENYTIRTAIPYIQEKCRECADAGHVELKKDGDKTVLVFNKTASVGEFATYIFEEDGYLKELYTKRSENPPYEAAQNLVKIDSFDAEWKEAGILQVCVAAEGKEEVFFLYLE